jgi:hypothetical protein
MNAYPRHNQVWLACGSIIDAYSRKLDDSCEQRQESGIKELSTIARAVPNVNAIPTFLLVQLTI